MPLFFTTFFSFFMIRHFYLLFNCIVSIPPPLVWSNPDTSTSHSSLAVYTTVENRTNTPCPTGWKLPSITSEPLQDSDFEAVNYCYYFLSKTEFQPTKGGSFGELYLQNVQIPSFGSS